MQPDDNSGLSRRSLLRKGAIATGAVTVGVPLFSETALATECPRTPGFWANHDWCEIPVSTSQDLGSVAEAQGLTCTEDGATGTYRLFDYDLKDDDVGGVGDPRTMSEWQEFLLSPPRGDKGVIMAKTLMATALNYSLRPGDDPDCVDMTVDLSAYGLGETTVREVVFDAIDWLDASNWDDGPQRDWVVSVGGTPVDGEPLKDVLDAFNNGTLGLDCDCVRSEDIDEDYGGDEDEREGDGEEGREGEEEGDEEESEDEEEEEEESEDEEENDEEDEGGPPAGGPPERVISW